MKFFKLPDSGGGLHSCCNCSLRDQFRCHELAGKGKILMFKKSEMIQCNVQIGSLVRSLQPKAQYFVDAMSSFGAVPLNLEHVDWVVSSANKCLQVEPCCPNLTVGDPLHWGYMCCLHGQLSFNEIPFVCFSTL